MNHSLFIRHQMALQLAILTPDIRSGFIIIIPSMIPIFVVLMFQLVSLLFKQQIQLLSCQVIRTDTFLFLICSLTPLRILVLICNSDHAIVSEDIQLYSSIAQEYLCIRHVTKVMIGTHFVIFSRLHLEGCILLE